LIQHRYLRRGRRRRSFEDELPVVAHHLFLSGALRFTESRKGTAQMNQCLFGSALQLFGESKQLGYTDALNDTNIHLPRQHFGAFIFQEFLEFMREYNEIQRIQSGFDEVVRFPTCQVVPGFQFGERGMYVGIGIPGVLLPRKLGENGEQTLQPHLLGLMAHDLP